MMRRRSAPGPATRLRVLLLAVLIGPLLAACQVIPNPSVPGRGAAADAFRDELAALAGVERVQLLYNARRWGDENLGGNITVDDAISDADLIGLLRTWNSGLQRNGLTDLMDTTTVTVRDAGGTLITLAGAMPDAAQAAHSVAALRWGSTHAVRAEVWISEPDPDRSPSPAPPSSASPTAQLQLNLVLDSADYRGDVDRVLAAILTERPDWAGDVARLSLFDREPGAGGQRRWRLSLELPDLTATLRAKLHDVLTGADGKPARYAADARQADGVFTISGAWIDPSLGVGEGENSWVAEQFVRAGLAATAER